MRNSKKVGVKLKTISNLSFPTLSNPLVLKYLVAGTQPTDKVTASPYPEPVPFVELILNQSMDDIKAVLATGYGRDREDLNLKRIEYGVDLDYLRDQDDPYYHALLVDAGYFLEHFKSHSDPRIRRLVAHQDPAWDTSQDPVYAVRHARKRFEGLEQMPLHLGDQLYIAGKTATAYRPLNLVNSLSLAPQPWLVTYLRGTTAKGRNGWWAQQSDVWLFTRPDQTDVDFSTFVHYNVLPTFGREETFVLYSDQSALEDNHRHPYIATLPLGRPHVLEIPPFAGDLEILVDDTHKANAILVIKRVRTGHRLHADLSPEDVEYLTYHFRFILTSKINHSTKVR